MRQLLYTAALIILASCQKEPIYISDRTVQDAINQWEKDAISHGIDLGDFTVYYEMFESNESNAGVAGHASYGGDTIYISDRWKGSDRNFSTVYHEIGHLFGLVHSGGIMSAYNTTQSVRYRDDLGEYFAMISASEYFLKHTKGE